MKHVWWTVAVALILTPARAEPNQYLCVVDQAVGFQFDAKANQWHPQVFSPGKKYIIRRLTADDRSEQSKWSALYKADDNWAFFIFGDKDAGPWATCRDTFGFYCGNGTEFDPPSLRFTVSYHGSFTSQGYWADELRQHPSGDHGRISTEKARRYVETPDAMFMEIGTCSPF